MNVHSACDGIDLFSAGLKAFSTWWCLDIIEVCRQCLGGKRISTVRIHRSLTPSGHGYSSYSNLARLFADFAVMCTWEGDNTVMAQQAARYLVNVMRKGTKDKPLTGFLKYLENQRARLRSYPFLTLGG
jgi:acyl-CoA oxidase